MLEINPRGGWSGSVVEPQTPEGIRNLPLPIRVLEQDTLLPKSTGNTHEAVARPDMTEKLFIERWNL